MRKATFRIEKTAEFFRRGRETARAADRGQALPGRAIVSFEDPADLLKVLTPARLALFKVIKAHPGSIASIAASAGRDRRAITRDVSELNRFGLVSVTEKVHPGHGRMKEVRASATQIKLEATID